MLLSDCCNYGNSGDQECWHVLEATGYEDCPGQWACETLRSALEASVCYRCNHTDCIKALLANKVRVVPTTEADSTYCGLQCSVQHVYERVFTPYYAWGCVDVLAVLRLTLMKRLSTFPFFQRALAAMRLCGRQKGNTTLPPLICSRDRCSMLPRCTWLCTSSQILQYLCGTVSPFC